MGREYTRSIISVGSAPLISSVIFSDDFESILSWFVAYGLNDYIFEIDPTISYQKNQSLYIETRTTNAADNDYVVVRRDTYLLPTKTVTLTGHFYIPTLTNLRHILFAFAWMDGTDKHDASIEWRKADKKCYYLNNANTMTEIPVSLISLAATAWHRITIKLNFNTDKYISLSINQLELDLSSLSFYKDTDPSGQQLVVDAIIKTDAAGPAKLHLDEFTLTEI